MYEQPFNPFAKNLAIVKSYFKSGNVLAIGIMYIVSAILTILTAVFSASAVGSVVNDAMPQLQEMLSQLKTQFHIPEDYYNELITSLNLTGISSSISGSAVSVLIAGLIAAAFLAIYFKSRNADPSASPKAGVMILYVLSVITMVMCIIVAVFAAIALIVMFWLIVQFRTQLDSAYSLVLIFAVSIAVAVVIGLFLALFTVVNRKRFFGSVKDSISSVELRTEGAKPYGVMLVLMAIFSGFGLLSIPSLFLTAGLFDISSGSYLTYLILSSLAEILNFVLLVLQARLVFGYKKYIEDMKYGYTDTSAPDAPYNPYSMGQGFGAPENNPYVNAAPVPPAAPAVCPSCGSPVDPSAPFCSQCGTKL